MTQTIPITITHAHMARALAAPWSTTTCIVAQAIMDTLGISLIALGGTGGVCSDGRQFHIDDKQQGICQWHFDRSMGNDKINAQDHLTTCASMLPLTFNLEITTP